MNMFFLAVFPLAMIFGALWDLTTMTIPNPLTIALAVMFVVLVPFAGLTLSAIALHVAAGALMLVAGMALFAFGWIGGWSDLLGYLVIASVLGGALTLALLWFRRMPLSPVLHRHDWIARLHNKTEGVPYGIALAAAGLVLFPQTVWFAAAARAA